MVYSSRDGLTLVVGGGCSELKNMVRERIEVISRSRLNSFGVILQNVFCAINLLRTKLFLHPKGEMQSHDRTNVVGG